MKGPILKAGHFQTVNRVNLMARKRINSTYIISAVIEETHLVDLVTVGQVYAFSGNFQDRLAKSQALLRGPE